MLDLSRLTMDIFRQGRAAWILKEYSNASVHLSRRMICRRSCGTGSSGPEAPGPASGVARGIYLAIAASILSSRKK